MKNVTVNGLVTTAANYDQAFAATFKVPNLSFTIGSVQASPPTICVTLSPGFTLSQFCNMQPGFAPGCVWGTGSYNNKCCVSGYAFLK